LESVLIQAERGHRTVDRRLRVLGAVPLFILLTTLLGSPTANPGEPTDALLDLQALGAIAAVLVWVRLDAKNRSFRVPWSLWIALAGLTGIALPYYLLRSRGAGAGLCAIGWALVLFSVTMVFYRLGLRLSAIV
jgi:hypothetical protein